MWLFSRHLIQLIPLFVVSCGFTPVYSPNSSFQDFNNQIQIQNPHDENSFIFVQELETQLGSRGNQYSLTFNLTTQKDPVLTSRIGRTLRFNINGKADFTLTKLDDSQIIYQGQVTNFTSYSTAGTTVEARLAEQEAHIRLMRILANQVLTQLYASQEFSPQ